MTITDDGAVARGFWPPPKPLVARRGHQAPYSDRLSVAQDMLPMGHVCWGDDQVQGACTPPLRSGEKTPGRGSGLIASGMEGNALWACTPLEVRKWG